MKNAEKRMAQYPYWIIAPDGMGSKGDEAMISGCLNLLQGERALLITPNANRWSDVMIKRTHLFDEVSVDLNEMPSLFHTPGRLIVVGADTLDGSCGYGEAHWRLEAIRTAAENGSRVVVFCSIRSDMDEKLIQDWKRVPREVSIFLRDKISEKNFEEQVGSPTKHFSDLAFFAKPIRTKRVDRFKKMLNRRVGQKKLLGLEISETMFRSFNTVIDDENRKRFAAQVAALVADGLSPDNFAFLLLTHDTRTWQEHWSDYQYACAAKEQLDELGFGCIVQPPELSQAELLELLPSCELLVCGRMHISITACSSGVVPLVVAGIGKNYVMIDKVRGMCREWLGVDQNLISDVAEIPAQRDRFLSDRTWFELLAQKRKQLETVLPRESEAFCHLLNVEMVEWDAVEVHELELSLAFERLYELNCEYGAAKTELQNKDARIEQLSQSERDLRQTLEAVQGECQQLRDKENQLKNEIDRLVNSRSYRLGQKFAKIFRFFLPRGSRRALLCRLTWKAVRHPILFMRSVSKRRIKKFFHLMKSGETDYAGRMMDNVVGNTAASLMPITPPEIVAVDLKAEKTQADYPILAVPQWAEPKVSIIIPVYNQFEYTYRCVESILRNTGDVTYEIIIANDCSTDLTTHIEEILPGVRCVTNPENLRFLRNCNNAAKHARGQYVLFLNNDTQVMQNWLAPLVELIESAEDIGMVGSKLIYPDGKLQEAGGILWRDGSAWNYGNGQNPDQPEFNYVKQVDYISGAAIMLSRALWEEIGGFDEHFVPAYCEDSDLAFTVRAKGYRVMYQPRSVVVHFEGVSNGTDTSSGQKKYQIENSKKFREKWKEELEKHPENGVNVFRARDYSYEKKTLLMVDHYVPQFDKDAGSRTVFQYLKMFAQAGFNVKFIGDNFYRHEPYTTVLQQLGIEVLYGPDYARGWKEWVRKNGAQIDYVFLNRPHIAPRYLDFLRENTNARIMYYGHDLAFLREMREYEITGDESFRKSSEVWKPKELSLMRQADMAYYPSYVEVEEIHAIDPAIKVKAIPAYLFDGVNFEGYDFDSRRDIMFIGGFSHRPNVDAVKWLAEEILPELLKLLPDVKIHVLGSNAPNEVLALANEHLILEGFVTDEQLEGFYRNSRISLVPLRYGAGIKGKVIEAMRYGTPVVTTPTGAEGIPDAEQVMAVESDAKKLAETIAALYQDREALGAMSQNAITYIQQNYSTDNAIRVIGAEFDLS